MEMKCSGLSVYVAAITITASCIVGPAAAQTGDDAKALQKQLFVTNEYNKKIRSSHDQTKAQEIVASLYPVAINELDDAKEILQTNGQLVLKWMDEYLQWDPADYGGLDVAHWPQDDIWKPTVSLVNTYSGYTTLGDPSLNVEVSPDGIVIWTTFQVFHSTCSVNIKYYPYDVQTCDLVFAALGYSPLEVTLFSGDPGISLHLYTESALWSIESTLVKIVQKPDQMEPTIVFMLTLRRKPLYVVLTIIVPIILLMVLNIFVFVLPSSSGEKSGYAVTVFLAFAVFLTIISTTLPKNSESVSILSVYLLIQTIQSTVITLITLVLIRISAYGPDKPIPKSLIKIIQLLDCKRCGGKRGNAVGSSYDSGDKCNAAGDGNKCDVSSENWAGTRSSDDGSTIDWNAVVDGLDIIFFFAFLTTATVSTVVCLVMVSTS